MHRRHFVARFVCALGLLGSACGNPQADGEIAVKVDQEIANSPVLGGARIDVAARDGVVTLSGVVASEEQALRAEKLAWSVQGVDGVESRLVVSGPAETPPVAAPPPAPPEGVTR